MSKEKQIIKKERKDIIKRACKIGELISFYNASDQLVKEEYYFIESIIEYGKSGKKEIQVAYDRKGNITHIIKYAPDGSVYNVINLSK